MHTKSKDEIPLLYLNVALAAGSGTDARTEPWRRTIAASCRISGREAVEAAGGHETLELRTQVAGWKRLSDCGSRAEQWTRMGRRSWVRARSFIRIGKGTVVLTAFQIQEVGPHGW
jgi:hypothetical protein